MLDIKFIRENRELIEKNNKDRGVSADVGLVMELDEERRRKITEIEELRKQRKVGSKGKPSPEDIQKMRDMGDKIAGLEKELAVVESRYLPELRKIPNLTHPDTPIGGEDDFKVTFTNWEPKKFDFTPKDHEQLMTDMGLIDFERGAKVATAKFYFALGDLVRLNLALTNYGIDVVTRHGYRLVETPDLAKNEILSGIGFNPRGPETQVYSVEGDDDLSLIGTAEITMGGYHAGEILDLTKGPLKYVALSHCYRTEAGAGGRTSKGLYRVHQFTKLEMFVYCLPEDSERLHQEILEIEKEIANGLELPYRVIDIASGDLGGPVFRKYDVEAWMTMKGDGKSQGGYGEITSTSNCTDYQARRLNIRHRKPDGTNELVHTLNGTAVVLSRFPVAIFENHQQADGSIAIPKALQPYFGKDKIEKE